MTAPIICWTGGSRSSEVAAMRAGVSRVLVIKEGQ
jgi:hypothetical protein